MTDSFRTMTPEQIQAELDKCGLTEEQIKKMGHRLRHPTAQQYILEKNLLSGTNNILTWCLTILAVYLLFLLFANINPGNFLQSSSVCFSFVSFIISSSLKLVSPLVFLM